MKKIINSQNIITKLILSLLTVAVIVSSIPLTAQADERDEILGVWRGTFRNTAGQHGIEMAVFRDQAGNYAAMTWLFPIPGGPQMFADQQQYRSDVIFNNASGRFETMNCTWVNGSGNLARKTLVLIGDSLSGHMISSITGAHHTDFTYDFSRIPRSNFTLGAAHEHIEGAQPLHMEEPTCYLEGFIVLGCIFCNYEIVQTPPAIPHTPSGTWVTRREPTCAMPGERVQFCASCPDEVVFTEQLPAIPHTPSDRWTVLTPPTETTDGVEALFCSYCDYEIERAPITFADFNDETGGGRTNRADASAGTAPGAAANDNNRGFSGATIEIGNTEIPLIVAIIIVFALILLTVLGLAFSRKGKKKQPIQHTPQTPMPQTPQQHSMPTQPHTMPLSHGASPEHTIVQAAFCGKCGNQVQENSGFCGRCGHKR